jgi:hypothetical protein
MAFLRFTRDKRGYEHFYLVQPTTNRRGKVRTRILYWFRTPPNVKVGRQPFDDALRRALEAQNPGVAFDWQKIVDTPIPSADAEKWRERRGRNVPNEWRARRRLRWKRPRANPRLWKTSQASDEPTTEAPRTDVSDVRAAQPDEQQQQRQHSSSGGGDATRTPRPSGPAARTPAGRTFHDASTRRPHRDIPESHEPQ